MDLKYEITCVVRSGRPASVRAASAAIGRRGIAGRNLSGPCCAGQIAFGQRSCGRSGQGCAGRPQKRKPPTQPRAKRPPRIGGQPTSRPGWIPWPKSVTEVVIGKERQPCSSTGPGPALSCAARRGPARTIRTKPAAAATPARKRASKRRAMNRRLRIKRNRAGYVLVMFAMMFLGLLGLAALVIDMGFVRLARRRCKPQPIPPRWKDYAGRAHNTWALPPAWSRIRTCGRSGASGHGSLSPQQSDQVRRWAASQVVADGPLAGERRRSPACSPSITIGRGGR